MRALGLDIGSNSVGSAWIDHQTGQITVGISVFPAGVDESEEKRGEPKNVNRRKARRTRITLARRARRKRALRLTLIAEGLLPRDEQEYKKLLQTTDPWVLRRKGLTESLEDQEFGRVLLHLAQRRGALGFDAEVGDKGEVKKAVVNLHLEMLDRYGSTAARSKGRELRTRIEALSKKKRTDQEDDELDSAHEQLNGLCQSLLADPAVTFGRFIADLRDEWRTPITTVDKRKKKKGPREWRQPVRNRAGKFQFHADRAMIRDEFAKLWTKQKQFGTELSKKLSDDLRRALDNDSRDSDWRHKGLLFGQRKASWDVGTLGRCVLEPTERCVPHADMYASRYLVVETLNNLKIIEHGRLQRPLTKEERNKIKALLTGPLGVITKGKQKGQPKRSVSVTDLRELMGWGRATKTSQFRFTMESDEERTINTDWFSREIIHGAITPEKWDQMSHRVRDGINRAILKYDPDEEKDAAKLKSLVMQNWAGLTETQADALIAAWKKRPRPDAKRLNMSRRAVRNLLAVMDRDEPWPDPKFPGQFRWLTQIEARKLIAQDEAFRDVTTGKPLDDHAKRRYATGARGLTARDRHFMRKHLLKRKGEPICGPDGLPLHSPPPAPLISNPVVRKAIHEVRRHIVEYMRTFACKPEEIHVELARSAKMGKVDADRALFINRLRNRIRNEIAREFNLDSVSSTQRRAAIDRVILCVQQGGVCPLCGNRKVTTKITEGMAAAGSDCEVAHIIPRACGGHNGFANIVLAHRECNQEMDKRTPRQFWNDTLAGGFDEGIAWVEQIYGNIKRIKPSEAKTAHGIELWKCYLTEQARPKRGSVSPLPPNFFTNRFDLAKIERFKMDVSDIQEMTPSQLAATTYASRQVMTYLADALFDGNGLPERGGNQLIYPVDNMWASRLRREWGLFFDRHGFRASGLTDEQEHERKEKDRGDHRHHAIDAIAIALCTPQVRSAWEAREKRADKEGVNTADEEAMDNYRRLHRLEPPAPYNSREELWEAVRLAVFGNGEIERPISHRPVKRKLVGALHKATQYGPALDKWMSDQVKHCEPISERATVRQRILGKTKNDFLKPAHLRLPVTETERQAINRLARRLRIGGGLELKEAIKLARKRVKSKAFVPTMVDPKPKKSGIVRDVGLRLLLRRRLEERGINPDSYTRSELKKSIDVHGPLTHESGIPIHNVILLWSNTDPVEIPRYEFDYLSGKRRKLNAPNSLRLYDSQNNHHIEIRVKTNKKGEEVWTGRVVTTFDAAQQKRRKMEAYRKEGIPKAKDLRRLSKDERARFRLRLRDIDRKYPLVDRSDNDNKGGRFVMSLCEGEMLLMRRKNKAGTPGDVGYFVVAKLDKRKNGGSIVVVPHWDARAATERKDSEGNKVPDSKRDQFAITPTDLRALAPPGHPHAIKVRISPLGVVSVLQRD